MGEYADAMLEQMEEGAFGIDPLRDIEILECYAVDPTIEHKPLKVGDWYLVAHPRTGQLRPAKCLMTKKKFFGEHSLYFEFAGGRIVYLGQLAPTETITGGFDSLQAALNYRKTGAVSK